MNIRTYTSAYPYILSCDYCNTVAHPPAVTVTPSSIAGAEGDSITLTCLATGVGASDFTYEWSLNSSLINGATERNYNITVSEITIGNYTCIVKNQFGGSSQSNTAILTLSKHSFCSHIKLCDGNITFIQSHHFVIQ